MLYRNFKFSVKERFFVFDGPGDQAQAPQEQAAPSVDDAKAEALRQAEVQRQKEMQQDAEKQGVQAGTKESLQLLKYQIEGTPNKEKLNACLESFKVNVDFEKQIPLNGDFTGTINVDQVKEIYGNSAAVIKETFRLDLGENDIVDLFKMVLEKWLNVKLAEVHPDFARLDESKRKDAKLVVKVRAGVQSEAAKIVYADKSEEFAPASVAGDSAAASVENSEGYQERYDNLVNSPFGSILGMLGGEEAIKKVAGGKDFFMAFFAGVFGVKGFEKGYDSLMKVIPEGNFKNKITQITEKARGLDDKAAEALAAANAPDEKDLALLMADNAEFPETDPAKHIRGKTLDKPLKLINKYEKTGKPITIDLTGCVDSLKIPGGSVLYNVAYKTAEGNELLNTPPNSGTEGLTFEKGKVLVANLIPKDVVIPKGAKIEYEV